MKALSVIICCYNERDTILEVIGRTKAAELGPDWTREIIVVDNASTDGTRELLEQIDDPEVRTFFHPRNLGKGMSIRTGIAQMRGDYMLIQDADLEYNPAEHANFCAAAADGPAAIFGSRVLGGRVRYRYLQNYLGVRFLTTVTNLLFGGRLTDVATATKMVRADIAQGLNLTSTGFALDFELPNKILLAGYEILEIPITYEPRTAAEGKKIRPRDGLKALAIMLRDRLGLSAVWKETAAPLSPPTSAEPTVK